METVKKFEAILPPVAARIYPQAARIQRSGWCAENSVEFGRGCDRKADWPPAAARIYPQAARIQRAGWCAENKSKKP